MPALIFSGLVHGILLLLLSALGTPSWHSKSVVFTQSQTSGRGTQSGTKTFDVIDLARSDLPVTYDWPGALAAPVPAQNAPAGNKPLSGAPPLSTRRYYRTNELDIKPQIMVHVDPEFPLTVDPGTKGSVVLLLLLDSDGKVESVVPLRSIPEGVFDEVSLKAFRQARYTPGIKDGKPVHVQLAVEIEFESNSLK